MLDFLTGFRQINVAEMMVKTEWVMAGESGESKAEDEVTAVGRGESEMGRLVGGWWREAGNRGQRQA